MKKRIQLTERQLRNMVRKAVLTEMNWKTYMNAANKARERCLELGYYDENEGAYVPYDTKDWEEYYKNLERMESFIEAAQDAYRKEYSGDFGDATHREKTDNDNNPINWERSYTEPWDEYEHSDDESDDEYEDNRNDWYGITDTYFPNRDNQNASNYDFFSPSQPEDDDWWSNDILMPYSDYSENSVESMWGDDNPDRPSIASSYNSNIDTKKFPKEFNDVYHYNRGDYKYTKGKGYQLKGKNESLARRVTESVMRKLRRM